MKTIETLQITKFFDVKTPVGLVQRGEDLTNYSIGIDLYMPKFTEEFIQAICDVNKKLYPNICYIEYSSEGKICIYDGDDLLAKILFYPKSELSKDEKIMYSTSGEMIFNYMMLQIPTGIGINIPNWAWCEVRTKSSNFQNGYTEIHGTVDMNYTYGVGVQILPSDDVIIKSDEKFAQLVFHEAVPVMSIEEISQENWNNIEEIKYKREKRIGGFGSTGKF